MLLRDRSIGPHDNVADDNLDDRWRCRLHRGKVRHSFSLSGFTLPSRIACRRQPNNCAGAIPA